MVEQEIAEALQQDEAWAAAAARLATVSGLGTLTIAWILTTTVNFTLTATPEAAANYAGWRLNCANRAAVCVGGHALGMVGMPICAGHCIWRH